MRLTRRALALAALPMVTVPKPAAAWPERPIRLVVPFVGGSSSDTLARLVAQALGEELGQRVVVENRAGAGGLLAIQSVQRAEPDGYTLLFAGSTLSQVFFLQRTPGFDPLTDFTPVVRIVTNAAVLCVQAGRPWADVAALVAAARAAPQGLTYGSGGVSTAAHLAGAALLNLAGASGIHVPYNGANQATLALARGDVDFAFAIVNIALPYVRDGTFRALLYAGGARNPVLPEVPAFPEAIPGAPGMENWSAIVAPARLPAVITERLHAAVVARAGTPEFAAVLRRDGNAVFLSASPADVAAYLAAEHAATGRLVRLAGAAAD
jgi:tripartite-type tricarboxylate transporter receptor subunit TctC